MTNGIVTSGFADQETLAGAAPLQPHRHIFVRDILDPHESREDMPPAALVSFDLEDRALSP